MTRSQVDALIWLNNGAPKEICDREPTLHDYGFYRKLDSGQLEFLSFCAVGADGQTPLSEDYVSMKNEDFQKLMDELQRQPKSK